MKEYLSKVDCEDYHKIIYPSVLSGDTVLQKDWVADDLLILPNPERYPTPKPTECKEFEQVRHGLQGEFQFSRPVKLKPLVLKEVPRRYERVR